MARNTICNFNIPVSEIVHQLASAWGPAAWRLRLAKTSHPCPQLSNAKINHHLLTAAQDWPWLATARMLNAACCLNCRPHPDLTPTKTLTLTLTPTHVLRGRPECSVLRAGFRKLINVRRSKELAKYKPSADADFAAYLKATYTTGLAVATDEANEQHYTCPTEYFDLALGEYKKYSCCVFEEGDTLEDAEVCTPSILHWPPSPRVPRLSP
jgi:hypothetical protein